MKSVVYLIVLLTFMGCKRTDNEVSLHNITHFKVLFSDINDIKSYAPNIHSRALELLKDSGMTIVAEGQDESAITEWRRQGSPILEIAISGKIWDKEMYAAYIKAHNIREAALQARDCELYSLFDWNIKQFKNTKVDIKCTIYQYVSIDRIGGKSVHIDTWQNSVAVESPQHLAFAQNKDIITEFIIDNLTPILNKFIIVSKD